MIQHRANPRTVYHMTAWVVGRSGLGFCLGMIGGRHSQLRGASPFRHSQHSSGCWTALAVTPSGHSSGSLHHRRSRDRVHSSRGGFFGH